MWPSQDAFQPLPQYPGNPQYPYNPPLYPGPPGASPTSSACQLPLSWVPAKKGDIPHGAVSVGSGVYVARGRFNGELIPGKAATNHRDAYLPYGGMENPVKEYEVLCDTHLDCFGPGYGWQRCSGGNLPPNAVIGGYSADRLPYHIARSSINNEAVAGKAFTAHQCAYFPYGGSEHRHEVYDVLVLK